MELPRNSLATVGSVAITSCQGRQGIAIITRPSNTIAYAAGAAIRSAAGAVINK